MDVVIQTDETLPSPTPPAAPLTVPAMISRFEIKSKLGEGGMGVVLLAIDPLLGRRVALKVLNRRDATDDAKRRFLREAQAMAKVSHENVIVVHEVGTHDGQVYLAMECVTGGTLTRWPKGRAELVEIDRDWREVLEMYVRAGRGLAAAHAAGLVHRDFKPDNVLVGEDGRVRVTDFGLVAAIDAEPVELTRTEQSLRQESELAVSLTGTGTLMGTPRFMAPEQHLGNAVDARADQFAFCVALYEALYQQPPFGGATYSQLVANVLAGEVAAVPAGSQVPAGVRAAVLRGLSRNRSDRYPSMRELLAALQVRVPSPRMRRWAIRAVAATVIVAAGLAGYQLHADAAAARDHAARAEERAARRCGAD